MARWGVVPLHDRLWFSDSKTQKSGRGQRHGIGCRSESHQGQSGYPSRRRHYSPRQVARHSTVLIDGVACLYERLQDGTRQIYAFQYSGDFCDLHQHVLPETNNEVAVAAITDCSIGIIEHKDLEQLIARYPSLGLALWRASMLEASIFRKRLLNVGRQPALQRVAHLLCEQLARREAVGLDSATIPLTQMDLADAAGLSIVHINRTFQELRRLNILSKEGRAIKVVDRERLAGLASFDGNYLNMPQLLSHWQVKIESISNSSRTVVSYASFLHFSCKVGSPRVDRIVRRQLVPRKTLQVARSCTDTAFLCGVVAYPHDALMKHPARPRHKR